MPGARHVTSLARCVRCHEQTLTRFLSIAGLQFAATNKSTRASFEPLSALRQYTATSRLLTNSHGQENLQKTPRLEQENEWHNDKPLDSTVVQEHQEAFEEMYKLTAEQEAELQAEIAAEESHITDQKAIRQSNDSTETQEDVIEAEKSDDVPWYLQEEEEALPITPMADRQRLPALPDNAPQNLATILERLSVDIGLDYLRLIDLRGLDPPPALGSGVIMVVGTARSEKHLHVSGDRFARWLRQTYKSTVNADGLLGRNELKLKLRRKAKRAKLLSSVGGSLDPDEDDGTRAGWICVDAGIIEQVESAERSLDESGIVGFGGKTDGTKLIVQMMTEDKRREIDLEALWERALDKHRIRKERAQLVEMEEDDNMVRETPAMVHPATPDAGFKMPQTHLSAGLV